MAIIQRILCPIDFSECSDRALQRAGVLARWFRAELTALHVDEAHETRKAGPGAARDERGKMLARVKEVLGPAGAKPELHAAALLREGRPAKEIVQCATEGSSDLIVMGTHGRSGLERYVVGSVAEAVVRTAPCPVLTIPPGGMQPGAAVGAPFKTILCPVDFSPTSQQALSLGFDLARQSDARLIEMNVVEILPEWESRELAHFSVPEFARYMEDDAIRNLRELVPSAARGFKVEQFVSRGKAWREILRIAGEQKVDLIVIGTGGHGPLDAFFVGSTTSHVLRGAACPVMTIRRH